MGSCWEAEPARRPPFRKIVEKLGRELRSVGVSAPAGGQEAEGSHLEKQAGNREKKLEMGKS